jgi:hypothetical protein
MGTVVRAVFVFEGLDVDVHPSIERAAASVEAIDVDNGEFDFFTDDGSVLEAATMDGEVLLRPTGERKLAELSERLRLYLDHPRVSLDPSLADDPLVFAQSVFDKRWQQRSFQWFPWLDRRRRPNGPPRVV